MSQLDPQLQELINEMQTMQAAQEDAIARMRARVEWLEARRREFYEILNKSSADLETRRKLEDIENQLDEIQKTLARSDEDLKSSLKEIRKRILSIRNDRMSEIEGRTKVLRQRREEIRTVLLPEATARVATLNEEDAQLFTQIEEMTRQLRDLDQIEMPPTLSPNSKVA